jgi:aspartyl-tRNA(Asn)/glutamyl-tRNA(Gln) amidotransferase subunit A
MSQTAPTDPIITQLRVNLAAAGISITDTDLQGIIEKGFLERPSAVLTLLEQVDGASQPDYTNAWLAPAPNDPEATHEPYELPEEQAATEYLSIGTIAKRLREGQVNAIELTKAQLARAEQIDPQLNIFQRLLAERALKHAELAQQAFDEGTNRGLLHGVPVVVKDLIDMAGIPTTAGSKILADNVPAIDAGVVSRLEQAGAIILGKTRMSEFAYSPGSNNGHYGSTANPWDTKRDAGGSSSGSAVAVATGIAYAALGSDTGGSIRIPASLCGIVGFKPTFGRVAMNGSIPLAWSLDHIGPLTRNVADAALMLTILAGPDARDTRSLGSQPFLMPALDQNVAGLRVGYITDNGTKGPIASESVLAQWQQGLAALEQAGAHLVPLEIPEMSELIALNVAQLAMEAGAYHLPWMRSRLDDYSEFMRQRLLSGFAYTFTAPVRIQQRRAELRRRMEGLFERVDLLSTPTLPDTAPPIGTPSSTQYTGPFNLLGWPAISLPVGRDTQGIPVGLQLIGRPWDEAGVLRAAYALEQTLKLSLQPNF